MNTPTWTSPTVGEVAARLGSAVLWVAPGAAAAAPVVAVVVHDPLRPGPIHPGDLVLGVGVPVAEAEELARRIVAGGGAGLVVRAAPGELNQTTAAVAVADTSIEWARLADLVRRALERDSGDESLFALCDGIAERCGGAVVLHDGDFRLLAYSSGQDLADPVRRSTILARQAPAEVRAQLASAGASCRLAAGEIVVLDAGDPVTGAARRAGVAVRARAEVLGSLWLQLGPTSAIDERVLQDCASVAAGVLVHRRVTRAAAARQEDELLSLALRTGSGVDELAVRLGATDDQDSLSVLMALRAETEDQLQRTLLAEHWNGIVHGTSAAYRWTTCTAVVGDTLYTLRRLRPHEPDDALRRVAGLLHGQLSRLATGRVVSALSEPAPVGSLSSMRRQVDSLVRLLRRGAVEGDSACTGDHCEALALEAVRQRLIAADEPLPDGPVKRLIEQDRPRGGELVRTLRTYFECGGDVTLAGEALVLHPNSVRYRIRRAQRMSGLDLSNPHQRFLAELQLRLLVD